MRALLATACFGSAFVFATASWAGSPETANAVTPQPAKPATLEPVKGDAWINHGKGFEKVNDRIEAKVGDSVMVNAGGIAKVTYADGCQANVKPGAVMTIKPLSPCASGSIAADMTPMVYKAAPAAAQPAEFTWWPVLLLPPAGALIGCAIAGCFQGPSSP